jgi:hypothetical protein
MATFEKEAINGRRESNVGFPSDSDTFATKAEAKAWAAKTEAAMIALKRRDGRVVAKTTIASLMDRKNAEVGSGRGFGRNKTAVLKLLRRLRYSSCPR